MQSQPKYSEIIKFFRETPPATPGDQLYNAAFCKILIEASSAEEASIWQLDSRNRLHPVYGTNFTSAEIKDVVLREGEGIGGAVVISRQTLAVSQAVSDSRHDPRVDERIGFATHSMISAPILFSGKLYGIVNILNHPSGMAFPSEWEDRLSLAGALYAAALASVDRLHLYDVSPIADAHKPMQFPEGQTVVVGASCAIQEVLHLCVKAAKSDIPVLIQGETGTGKELAARRIHEASQRFSGPFIDVNCAAVTESLLESELFGHVKGAFSGATSNRKGKFLAASGGTLFLDEIGNMDRTFQAKILRVLQEKKLSPVGSEKTVSCDARIVSATNQVLREKVEAGTFREDLFYRLCGIEIIMPPLRERLDDIPVLARYFLNRACAEEKERNPLYRVPTFSIEALQMLMAFDWPGNVRQLEQAVLAALTICETDEIQPKDFPAWFHNAVGSYNDPTTRYQPVADEGPDEKIPGLRPVKFGVEERMRYLETLDLTKYDGTGRWNYSAAARRLGVPRKTFMYRLKRMQII